MSGGRDVVSLTLDSSERGDAGNWTCTAQVYETGSLTVGGPEERSVQLVVVGRFSIKHLDLHNYSVSLSSNSCTLYTRRFTHRTDRRHVDIFVLVS